jgi:hypothetical protein
VNNQIINGDVENNSTAKGRPGINSMKTHKDKQRNISR